MGATVAVSPSYAQRAAMDLRTRRHWSDELTAMARRWRAAADRTDRDHSCADDLDEMLNHTDADELRGLSTRWHALAHLSGGDHRYADELDQWLRRLPADTLWSDR